MEIIAATFSEMANGLHSLSSLAKGRDWAKDQRCDVQDNPY